MPRFIVLSAALLLLGGAASLGSKSVAVAAPSCYTGAGDAYLQAEHDDMVRMYKASDYNGALTQAQHLASNAKSCIEGHAWDSNGHINRYFTVYAVAMEYAGLVRKRQGDNVRARHDFEAARTQWQNLAEETNSDTNQIALAHKGVAWADRQLGTLPGARGPSATPGRTPPLSRSAGSAPTAISPPVAACLGFSGVWETEFGKMEISVNGTRGSARYVDPQGDTNTLSGTVEDGVFHGRFNEPNRGTGVFRFLLTGAGETWYGTYEYDHRTASGTWHGRCIAGAPTPTPATARTKPRTARPRVVTPAARPCSSILGNWGLEATAVHVGKDGKGFGLYGLQFVGQVSGDSWAGTWTGPWMAYYTTHAASGKFAFHTTSKAGIEYLMGSVTFDTFTDGTSNTDHAHDSVGQISQRYCP